MIAISMFALTLGEELWQAYLPAYLTALGASGFLVGVFASLRDLFDSAYQYPGGWLSDRFGRRRSLLFFTGVATAGYAVYALASSWPVVFAGLAGVMWWKAGAFPTTFAVIGDALPLNRRALAFGVQSALTRISRIIAAPLGGVFIATLGIVGGLRRCFLVTVGLGLIVLMVQYVALQRDAAPSSRRGPRAVRALFAEMPPTLRRLLAADALLRVGEGIGGSFILLFILERSTATTMDYGLLYAVQQAVAIVSYLPGGWLADRLGRRGLVTLSFVFFAAFPLAVRLATGFAGLIIAFIIGGLKEVGEPARKSWIVDLAPAGSTAATVGIYYTLRNLLVAPAGLIGGLLWQQAPHLSLDVAATVCLVALALFILTSHRDIQSAVHHG